MKHHLRAFGLAVSAALAPMLLFLAILIFLPAVAPGLWLMVPFGLIAGFSILWRRYPRDAYPIGLLFVPCVGALLIWIAMLISWHVVGDYI